MRRSPQGEGAGRRAPPPGQKLALHKHVNLKEVQKNFCSFLTDTFSLCSGGSTSLPLFLLFGSRQARGIPTRVASLGSGPWLHPRGSSSERDLPCHLSLKGLDSGLPDPSERGSHNPTKNLSFG